MSQVGIAFHAAGHIGDDESVEEVAALFERSNPGFRLERGSVCAEEEWLAAAGSRVVWIHDGEGEILLPAGYRTKEGDGEPLPPAYRPEPAPPEWIDAVRCASARIDCFRGDLRTAIAGVCSRLNGRNYIGDCANDLWSWIEHDGVAPDEQFAGFIRLFENIYDRTGFSCKTESSWERVQAGDQVLVGADPLRIRGRFRYWSLGTPRRIDHISTVRRLRHLKDTAGGCNFRFDAFRRMALTWYPGRGATDANPDGINQVNSHWVNIAAETSRAHYHPREAVGGGKPQGEFYFVGDPASHGLSAHGRQARLTLWPDVENLRSSFHIPLRPGSVVYIVPGTGHRGIDVFANVVVLPGYKLKNQIFLTPPTGE